MRRRFWRAVSVVVFACFVTGFVGVALYAPQKPPRHQTTQTQHHQTADDPKPHAGWQWGHSDPGVTLVTLLLVGVAIGQAVLFYIQLRYMRVGMQDATAAANAAKQSAEAVSESNAISRKNFAASQRPWIKAKVEIAGPFSSDGNTAAVQLRIALQNVGATPALGIKTFVTTYPGGGNGPVEEAYERISASIRSGGIIGQEFGDVLFPNEQAMKEGNWTTAVWHQANIQQGIAKGDSYDMGLCILVCIDYVSNLRDEHYQTGFVFLLLRPSEGGGWKSLDLSECMIPQDQLVLVSHPLGRRIS